jgi:uncharacterized repeat protein (TIGR02543 family)
MKKTIVAVAALAAAWLAPTAGLAENSSPGGDPNMCTVTFNARGGSSTVDSKQVQRNSKVGSLPKASRTGCAFKGWYTKKSGGTKVKSTTRIKHDVTFYAQWQKRKYKVTVKAKAGGKATGGKKAFYGKKVKITAKAKGKYVFWHWKAGNAKSLKAFSDYAETRRRAMKKTIKVPNGNVKYTAYFVKKTVDKKTLSLECSTDVLDADIGPMSSSITVLSKSYPTVSTETLPDGVEFTADPGSDCQYTLKIYNADAVPPGRHMVRVYARNRSGKTRYIVIVVRGKGIN